MLAEIQLPGQTMDIVARAMEDHPLILAALTGFISGLILCIPVGPINLIIINEGARRGFKWAAMIGAGATLMELIYCFFAFTSFASFFERGTIKAAMELGSFVFMLFIGMKFLMAKSAEMPLPLSAKAEAIEHRIEEKLHPHSAFAIGFVRVLANPGVLLVWVIFAANFISREWVPPTWQGKLSCVAGVAVSIGGWFTCLSWFSSIKHGKLSSKALLRMERVTGIILLAIAFAHGAHIVWRMAHHR
ncbi:MAG: sporulation protein and putative transporter YcgF [Verrucomicrobiota bacterium]|jgi:threonine/homoserine/homoserine lactone efflux protein